MVSKKTLSAGGLQKAVKNSIRLLLQCSDSGIVYFAKRDLSEDDTGPIEKLWNLAGAGQILRRQLPEGYWRYPNARAKETSPLQDYDQLETYRCLGQLVEEYGMTKAHPAIDNAAEFLFGKQTVEGDFRGIYGRQYTPNYTGGIAELLTKAGYGDDPRIQRVFKWLLSTRQEDGGWAIPLRTTRLDFRRRPTHSAITSTVTVEPDLSRPSSHMVTGVVLRAFAAHEKHRRSGEALAAARLLPPRFFKKDSYLDRGGAEYWKRVSFPFWFTDIVSALDSLSQIGPTPTLSDEVAEALHWILSRQTSNGLFDLKLLRDRDPMLAWWVSLAICRILKRYSSIIA